MKFQLLSDLHLETEEFTAEPAPGAEMLVIAGDIDSTWRAFDQFADWPVPVLYVAGNHEFDRRELTEAWPALRRRCEECHIEMIECQSVVKTGADGRRIRFTGTVRWCDFDLFGAVNRDKAMRAASYFQKIMQATVHGRPFDAEAVREEGLACGSWLAQELAQPTGDWDDTVVITHFGPSLRSADPRFGTQPGTASFLSADDALLPAASIWVHGHVHCRHDYLVTHGDGRATRVVCNARGHASRGEADGYDALFVVEA